MPAIEKRTKIGLALSGGGYRASAFHLGTMRKLNQLGVLNKVDVFSTVSGGSIVGADYVMQLSGNSDYRVFEEKHRQKLRQSVIRHVLTSIGFVKIVIGILSWITVIACLQWTQWHWTSILLLLAGFFVLVRYQFMIFPVSKIIEAVYDRIFFNKKVLSDLPESPVIAINSTNLETGRQFTFSKKKMSDSTYEYPSDGNDPILFLNKDFPISRSVMASSSVPFAFVPIEIEEMFFKSKSDSKRAHPVLVDGGVFDNQGLHKLTQENSSYLCDIVIVSDAGNKMSTNGKFNNLVSLLFRCMDLFMNRIKKFQMIDNLYHNVQLRRKEIAYISLSWDLENCISGFVDNLQKGLVIKDVIAAHKIPLDYMTPFNRSKIISYLELATAYNSISDQSIGKTNIARGVGTNLTALSEEQINALINHAELMTELQIKLYCPSLK